MFFSSPVLALYPYTNPNNPPAIVSRAPDFTTPAALAAATIGGVRFAIEENNLRNRKQNQTTNAAANENKSELQKDAKQVGELRQELLLYAKDNPADADKVFEALQGLNSGQDIAKARKIAEELLTNSKNFDFGLPKDVAEKLKNPEYNLANEKMPHGHRVIGLNAQVAAVMSAAQPSIVAAYKRDENIEKISALKTRLAVDPTKAMEARAEIEAAKALKKSKFAFDASLLEIPNMISVEKPGKVKNNFAVAKNNVNKYAVVTA